MMHKFFNPVLKTGLIFFLILCMNSCGGLGSGKDKQSLRDKRELANYLYSIKKYPEAGREFRSIIQAEPEDVDANYKYAVIQQKLEMTQDSINGFQQVLKLDEDHQKAHFNLGLLQSQNDRFHNAEQSIYHFNKYLSLYPTSPFRQKIETKIAGLSSNTAIGTDFQKGEACYRQKDYAQAERHLKNHLMAYPKDSQAYYRLGMIYIKTDQFKKGRTELLRAISMDPDINKAYYNLGIVYSKKGSTYNKEKAGFFFKKYLELDPDSSVKKEVSNWLENNR